MVLDKVDGRKKKHRKQASKMQLTAIALRAKGMNPTEAGRRAGYSEATLRTPKKIFTSQAIVAAVDKYKLELKDKGLTTDYMATKIKEWLEAEDIMMDKLGNVHHQPNYIAQQNAYKFLKEVLIDEEKKKDQPIKKTLTLTEYLTPNTRDIPDSNVQDTSEAIELDTIQDFASTNTPHIIDTKSSLEESTNPYKETIEELII